MEEKGYNTLMSRYGWTQLKERVTLKFHDFIVMHRGAL